MKNPVASSPSLTGRTGEAVRRCFSYIFSPERRGIALALAAIACLLAVLYGPVFAEFGTAWLTYEEYHYAVLVPPTALFLLAWRWPSLRAQPPRPSARGVLLLGAGLILFLAGIETGVHVAQGLSFIPVVLGLLWFLRGRGAALAVLFPVAYLACGLGLYRGLISSLGFAMQGVTARYAAALSGLLGAHAQRDGLLLTLGHMRFVVAETCSGLSSLLALLALGWLVIGIGPGTLRFKALLFLTIAPLALIANIVRVALVMVIAQDVSAVIAQGFVHGLFSFSIFVITATLLLGVRQALLWLDHTVSRSSPRLS